MSTFSSPNPINLFKKKKKIWTKDRDFKMHYIVNPCKLPICWLAVVTTEQRSTLHEGTLLIKSFIYITCTRGDEIRVKSKVQANKELGAQIFRITFCRVGLSFILHFQNQNCNMFAHINKSAFALCGLIWRKTTFFLGGGRGMSYFFKNLKEWFLNLQNIQISFNTGKIRYKTQIITKIVIFRQTPPFGRHLIFWPILMKKVSKCSVLHSALHEMEPKWIWNMTLFYPWKTHLYFSFLLNRL